MIKGRKPGKEETAIEAEFRAIRNSDDRLLCLANDLTGEIETQGSHKSSYVFCIPVGGTFTVTRGNIKSLVTRTPTAFVVENFTAAA